MLSYINFIWKIVELKSFKYSLIEILLTYVQSATMPEEKRFFKYNITFNECKNNVNYGWENGIFYHRYGNLT